MAAREEFLAINMSRSILNKTQDLLLFENLAVNYLKFTALHFAGNFFNEQPFLGQIYNAQRFTLTLLKMSSEFNQHKFQHIF